jgi:lipoprotein-anchoring transpeptidase ErfK/SrfK
MEVLMGRSRQRRVSRAVIAFVVIAVAIGSIFQFHRTRKAVAESIRIDPAPQTTPLKTETPAIVTDVTAPKPQVPLVSVNNLSAPTTMPSANLTPGIWNTPKPQVQTTVTNTAPAAPSISTGPTPTPSNAISDARTKLNSGDLIAARKMLNDTLVAGNLSASDTDAVKKQISDINQTLIFSPRHFPNDPFGGVYSVQPGQKLGKIAADHQITWQLLLRLNGMTDPRKLRAGQTLKILNGPFHVVVNKSKFNMDVYLGAAGGTGSMYITSYGVGLGKDDSTPTGTWVIKDKVTHPTYYSPRGEGVIAADDPKNPLGPVWLGLAGTDGQAVGKASYGIHGTIEPDSIGKMASMGCIRMHNEDVTLVYELLIEGKSTVVVKD